MPSRKIASGGELARFALALKVALAEASPPAVLVFDEVDRGVGGAVADAVGERLQRLARTDAGAAGHAFAAGGGARGEALPHRARQGRDAASTSSTATARVEEIARMLAGRAGDRRSARRRAPPARRSAGSQRRRRSGRARERDAVAQAGRSNSPRPKRKRNWSASPKEIAEHDRRYYQDDAPTVSDAEYDALRRRNAEIEARFPELVRDGFARRERVGAKPAERFEKVRHARPMLSLDNAFTDDDVARFRRARPRASWSAGGRGTRR